MKRLDVERVGRRIKMACFRCDGPAWVDIGNRKKTVYCGPDCKKVALSERFNRQVALSCGACGGPVRRPPSHANRYEKVFCDEPCYARYQRENGTSSGSNSAVWKGGYEPYYGASWKRAQAIVRQRDLACADCNATPEQLGKELDVHHKIPFRVFGRARHSEANAPSNLVGLCHTCHTTREWLETRRPNPASPG